jgi:hypothetical protein
MAIKILYKVRPWFAKFHARRQRWAILVAHRRAGKTVAAVNDLIERASRNPLKNPRYAYVAPLLRQAKDVAWMYLKEAAAPFDPKISESGLYVELSKLPNSPRITLYGADNPDGFRGLYLDGLVLDEYGNMTANTFSEILLPALIDRRGWCVFMGTPNGPNHFREAFYGRQHDPEWLVEWLPVTVTNAIRQEDLNEMKKLMDEEQFAQEMLCSFEASVRGAIYARQMETMEAEGRIGDFPLDNVSPTDVVMDLGWRDDTTAGFIQRRPGALLMGHCYHDNLKPISYYIEYVKNYWAANKLKPGQVWLPWDARSKSLQTGKSIIENFRDANLRVKLVPNLDVLDGIAAARKTWPIWYFHSKETYQLQLALKSYHRKYDDAKKVFSDEPVHDWSSHYADMFRYANIILNPMGEAKNPIDPNKALAAALPTGVNYGFALNDLWDNKRGPNLGRIYG